MISGYVAASSRELVRARSVMERLRKVGMIITYDWTICLEELIAAGVTESELDDAVALRDADTDLDGVERAQIVVFLAPAPGNHTRGAWYEMGFADALNKLLLISGPYARQSIFCRRADALFVSDEELIEYIARMVA